MRVALLDKSAIALVKGDIAVERLECTVTVDRTRHSMFVVGIAMSVAPMLSAQESGYVGSESCIVCHEDSYETYQRSAHVVTETDADRWTNSACETCHGPGAAHVESAGDAGTIFSWTDPAVGVDDKTARCTACHQGDPESFSFFASGHAKGSVDCASCHASHPSGNQEGLSRAGQQACMACHLELQSTIRLNERHRMAEGMVQCVDCHEQHGPSTRTHLGGFTDEACHKCHTDKQGPFVFEHLSVSVEGCSSCHSPHGSVNRHMLSYQSTAQLCYSCHVVVPGFHKGAPGAPVRFDSTSVCTNCHSSIHGSNLDPSFLR